MKIKSVLLTLVCLMGGNAVSADRALVPAGDIAEQEQAVALVEERTKKLASARMVRENQQLVTQGVLGRAATALASGTRYACHVLKYPLGFSGLVLPVLLTFKDDFYSTVRRHMTLIAGSAAVAGLAVGVYQGPRDYAAEQQTRALENSHADLIIAAGEIAAKFVEQRETNTALRGLHGEIAQVNATLGGLREQCSTAAQRLEELGAQSERMNENIRAADGRLKALTDQTRQVIEEQQRVRVTEFIKAIQTTIQTDAHLFEKLKAIEGAAAGGTDITDRLQIALTELEGVTLCQDALAQMRGQAVAQELAPELQSIVDQLMIGARQVMQDAQLTRARLLELKKSLSEAHGLALAQDRQRMLALEAAAAAVPVAPQQAALPGVPGMSLATTEGARQQPLGAHNSFGGFPWMGAVRTSIRVPRPVASTQQEPRHDDGATGNTVEDID